MKRRLMVSLRVCCRKCPPAAPPKSEKTNRVSLLEARYRNSPGKMALEKGGQMPGCQNANETTNAMATEPRLLRSTEPNDSTKDKQAPFRATVEQKWCFARFSLECTLCFAQFSLECTLCFAQFSLECTLCFAQFSLECTLACWSGGAVASASMQRPARE